MALGTDDWVDGEPDHLLDSGIFKESFITAFLSNI